DGAFGAGRPPGGSRAWRVVQGAASTVARIGVGLGAGFLGGMPLEYAVTRATGNRHLGFAAGYVGGAAAGIAADAVIFGMTWGEAAAGAFSKVALAAAPIAVASHMMNVALDDLAEPVASGDQQAIDLALELTWGHGLGFFT